MITSVAAPSLHRLALEHMCTSGEEIDAALHPLAGTLPEGLEGVLWRNGPGRSERGGVRYGHLFDGDGFIVRFDLGPAGGRVRSRFVRTPEFLAEERADKILYRGFGTQRPGGIAANALRMSFKNVANTAVMWHAGRLHALWEGGLPTRIDPTTLDSLGRDDLGGALRGGLTPPTFSAHPCRDDATGTMFNFGLRWGLGAQTLVIYATDADGATRVERSLALDRLSFIHDFLLTPRWFVFLLPAVRFDVLRMALGLTTPVGSLRHEAGAAMTALLVPRDGGAPVAIETVPGFAFHLAGAYEQPNGHVVCDLMHLEGVPDLDNLEDMFAPGSTGGGALPVRLVLDPAARVMVDAIELDDTATEFPITAAADGRAYRSFWATAAAPHRRQPYHSALVRIEPGRGVVARRELFPALPSEPCFVPRPGARDAEDGWLLTICHRPGAASELWILDAETLAIEARLGIPTALPLGLHGCWAARAETI